MVLKKRQTTGGQSLISGESVLVTPSGQVVGSAQRPEPITRPEPIEEPTRKPKTAEVKAFEDKGEIEKQVKNLIDSGLSEKQARRAVTQRKEAELEPERAVATQRFRDELIAQGLSELESTRLAEQIQSRISERPSLEPRPIGELLPEFNQLPADFPLRLVKGDVGLDEIVEEARGFVNNIAIAGGVAAGAFAIPALAKTAASSALLKSGGLLSGQLGKLALTIGGLAIGGKVFDLGRGEISSLKGTLSAVQSHSSATLSTVKNAGDNIGVARDGLQTLRQLNEEIDFVESQLKVLGERNLKFRFDKEYIQLQAQIASTRQNVLERIEGVQTHVFQGQEFNSPEEIAFALAQLKTA